MSRILITILLSLAISVVQADETTSPNAAFPPKGEGVELVGSIQGQCWALETDGDSLFLGRGISIQVFDPFDPAQPRVESVIEMPRVSPVGSIVIHERRAYVTDGHSRLRIFDVSNSSVIVQLGEWATEGSIMAANGRFACLGPTMGTTAKTTLLDVSNPAQPQSVCETAPFHANTIALNEDILLVGSEKPVMASGLNKDSPSIEVFDISNPQVPKLLWTCFEYLHVQQIRIIESVAYIAAGWDGLMVLDISNPASPKWLGSWPQDAWDFDMVDSVAYVATNENGMDIVDMSDPKAPVKLGGYNVDDLLTDRVTVSKSGLIFTTDGRDNNLIFRFIRPKP